MPLMVDTQEFNKLLITDRDSHNSPIGNDDTMEMRSNENPMENYSERRQQRQDTDVMNGNVPNSDSQTPLELRDLDADNSLR